MMRNCAICKTPDRPDIIHDETCNCPGGPVEGHEPDCRKLRHYVKRVPMFSAGPLTPRLGSQGWKDTGLKKSGVNKFERFECVACIRRRDEIDFLARDREKRLAEVNGGSTNLSIYQQLCY